MRKLTFLLLVPLLCSLTLNGQKKRLGHDDYDLWRYIRSEQLSDDGKTGTWEIKPASGAPGNGVLFIHDFEKNFEKRVERGAGAVFFSGQKWVSYKIMPEYEVTRKAKIDKKSKDKMPKAEVVVMELSTGRSFSVKDAEASEVAKEAPVLAYKYKHTPEAEDSTKKPKPIDVLMVIDVAKGDTMLRVEKVDKFGLNSGGEVVYTIKEDSTGSIWVWKKGREAVKLGEHAKGGRIGQIAMDKENGKRFAYTIMQDSTENVQYRLFDVDISDFNQKEVDFTHKGLTFSNLDPVSYSKKGGILHFSIASPPQKPEKDTIPGDEKFTLDVWNYRDTLLQSQQLVQAAKVRNNTFQAMYDIENGYCRRLTHSYFHNAYIPAGRDNSPCLLFYDSSPYMWSYTWSAFPREKDIYLYYPEEDRRELVLTGQRDVCSLSPAAGYMVYYNIPDSTWYSYDCQSKETRDLTGRLGVNFYDELHDRPAEPSAYGMGGWLEVKGKGKKTPPKEYVLLYDRYDIWLTDPANPAAAYRLTQGRENKITYRVVRTDRDAEYCNQSNMLLLSVFNNDDKKAGIASLNLDKYGMPAGTLNTMAYGDHAFTFSAKAKNADRIFWRRESFTEYPDLHTSDLRFRESRKLTDANPQTRDYMWGSVELIRWQDPNGNTVEGLVYYPEDYDPGRKYPVMVYFYERSADNLNRHRQPYPSRSIICPTMFTSNDYVVFIPDINFRVGYPGRSSYDAVVSGSEELIKRGIADPERIGLQGQSWGGYQINYIVTRTDMFRCASAGAGVSDMVSGYATTRDDSGIARMLQYEAGQSRIGATLWNATDLYIENSPVFFLPNVNTPLLLRHSNNDDAVPFPQGMEMFNGLRRLGKEVWLLNYIGEAHNLTTRAACKDWAVRMTQFFDHYLKDAPMPRWMAEGINLRERGKELKLDLIEN